MIRVKTQGGAISLIEQHAELAGIERHRHIGNVVLDTESRGFDVYLSEGTTPIGFTRNIPDGIDTLGRFHAKTDYQYAPWSRYEEDEE